MKHTLSFSGWGQQALELPETTPFDYMRYGSIEEAFAALKLLPCTVAIGWSLGGQLVMRAVAAGIIRPEKLVLVATPLCFAHEAAESFYGAVVADSKAALKRFKLMIAEQDSHYKTVIRALAEGNSSPHLLYWLQQLYNFDATTLDMAHFPPSVILHGKRDKIVPYTQGEALHARLLGSSLMLWDEAAHAPHLHECEKFSQVVAAYVS